MVSEKIACGSESPIRSVRRVPAVSLNRGRPVHWQAVPPLWCDVGPVSTVGSEDAVEAGEVDFGFWREGGEQLLKCVAWMADNPKIHGLTLPNDTRLGHRTQRLVRRNANDCTT